LELATPAKLLMVEQILMVEQVLAVEEVLDLQISGPAAAALLRRARGVQGAIPDAGAKEEGHPHPAADADEVAGALKHGLQRAFAVGPPAAQPRHGEGGQALQDGHAALPQTDNIGRWRDRGIHAAYLSASAHHVNMQYYDS